MCQFWVGASGLSAAGRSRSRRVSGRLWLAVVRRWWRRPVAGRGLVPGEGCGDGVAEGVRVDVDRAQREAKRWRVRVAAPGQVVACSDAVEFEGQDLEWHGVFSLPGRAGRSVGVVSQRSVGRGSGRGAASPRRSRLGPAGRRRWRRALRRSRGSRRPRTRPGVAIARNFASMLPWFSNPWIRPRCTQTASPGPTSTVSPSIVQVVTPSSP